MDVLLDTVPIAAATIRREGLHTRSRAYFRTPGLRLHTTSEILAESYTFLRRRASYRVAHETVVSLRASQTVRIYHIDEAFDRDIWAAIDEFSGVPLSYADASLVVLGRRLRIRHAFSFDADLRAVGLELVPED
jgi:predicted nucleic acid-binding protein